MHAATSTPFAFADLVICTDASLREAFGLDDRAGLVSELRKKDARIVFTGPDRSLWIPFRGLRRATPREAESSPLAVIRMLAGELGGTTVEVIGRGGGAVRMIMRHGALTPERIDGIRDRLKAGLAAWTIRPGSMSRLESVMEVVPGRVPAAG